MSNGHNGVPMNSRQKSPARRKRDAAARLRQDKRWQARNGPVTVRQVEVQPAEVEGTPRAACVPQD